MGKQLAVLLLLFIVGPARSQDILLPNGYSHNDYWNKHPLSDALDKGYTYLEADIFLSGGKLVVAHTLPAWKKRKTLEELYFEPLQTYLVNRHPVFGNQPDITLMIDIKTDAEATYRELSLLLEKYRPWLSSFENGRLYRRAVNVVITGNRPFVLLSRQENRLAFIDADLRQLTANAPGPLLSPIASCRYSAVLQWRGKGELPPQQRDRLLRLVNTAHALGKKVRLWASPENTAVWKTLLACGVDLLNTNRLTELRNFLVAEKRYSRPDLPTVVSLSTVE